MLMMLLPVTPCSMHLLHVNSCAACVDACVFCDQYRSSCSWYVLVVALVSDLLLPVCRTRWMQVVAATSLHTHDERSWRIRPAPEADEVKWDSLRLRLWESFSRRMFLAAAVVLIALFFLVPVSAVQALLNVSDMNEHMEF